jgi:hypothetical protein
VEVFADSAAQGQYYLGRTTAGADGKFSFTSTAWLAPNITAIAFDAQGNISAFSTHLTADGAVTPTPTPPPGTPMPGDKIYLPFITK